MPAPRDTYVNPLLTDVSVAYKNNNFIAESIFPTVMVDKETGLYFVHDKENLRSPTDARRAEFGRANRVTNTLTEAAYALEEKSLEAPISDRVMRQYDDPFDPKRNATELVTEKLYLDREKDLQTTLVAGAATNTDLNGSWSTTTTDIIGLIRTARNQIHRRTTQKANVVLLGKPAYDVLLENAAFIERIKYTGRPTEGVIRQAIAEFFDVERVIIGEAVENTSKEGQADSLDYIWGDNVIVAFVASSPAIEMPSAGYHLTLRDARFIDEWYEKEIKTSFVRANDFYDSKIVVPDALYVYSDVVA